MVPFFLLFFFSLRILKRDAYCSFHEFNFYILTLYEVVLRTIILVLVSKPAYLTLVLGRIQSIFGGRICYSVTGCLFACCQLFFLASQFPVSMFDWEINLEAWRNACCCLEATLPTQQGGSPSLLGLMVLSICRGWTTLNRCAQ